MKTQDYQNSISADITPNEVFDAICRVSEWWTTNIKGSSRNLNDVFVVHFGDTSVTFKIIEVVPDQKIVWLVTDCYLDWIENKKEWNGTRIVFEIVSKGKTTQINFTHIGLVPELECYENCNEGWNFHFGESLLKLITEHQGMPQTMEV